MSMFQISGNDWLGIGAATSKEGTGTAECGAPPNCLFGSDCNKRKSEYSECTSKALDVKALETQLSSEINSKLLDTKSKEQTTKTIIYAVVGIVIVFMLIKMFKK